MESLEETKIQYLRAKEILEIASDGDNQSRQAQVIRLVWEPNDLQNLQKLVRSWEDSGIRLTLHRYE